jgi:hypothetical protein
MFQRTFNKRGNPFLDDISILLGPIKELKEGPEPTPNASPEENLLNFHECIYKTIKPMSAIGQSVEGLSEEELGCGVDREAGG